MNIATTFAIVANYQYFENYAYDADGFADTVNPYWKPKGGSEVVVVENLSVTDMTELAQNQDKINELINTTHPESNDFYVYDYLGFEVVEISEQVLKDIHEKCVKSDYMQDLDGFGDEIAVEYAAECSRYIAKKYLGVYSDYWYSEVAA